MIEKHLMFKQINEHLLTDAQPSEYFNAIQDDLFFSVFPFTMLSKLKETPQSVQHHPEGSVWNHTMLVIDEAAKVKKQSKNPDVLMWAALLHDIGKADTTRKKRDRVTSYDHDKVGAVKARQFLQEFTEDESFIEQVVGLVRWHMQILFVVRSMPFANVEGMKEQTDVEEIALLGLCDRMGRHGVDRKSEEGNIRLFLQKCRL
ncbi:HDIG domain-containing metalloprotein [Hydrogenoanaerobacterium sp.]|uniref:HDIG domain-containing metalloprotein n=1 Tax=Hydrogenoanaerobacterium sp. TaxID=2953763 RepID=UPI00289E3914|nr:HDIG domain-containing metalloprotein [Hydrogenoanaerobacterium sp.]